MSNAPPILRCGLKLYGLVNNLSVHALQYTELDSSKLDVLDRCG